MTATVILSFTLADSIAAFVGSIGAVLGIFACLAWDERHRRLRGDRAPTEMKLLRPPGYNLLKRWDALTEKILSAVLGLSGVGVLLWASVPPRRASWRGRSC